MSEQYLPDKAEQAYLSLRKGGKFRDIPRGNLIGVTATGIFLTAPTPQELRYLIVNSPAKDEPVLVRRKGVPIKTVDMSAGPWI